MLEKVPGMNPGRTFKGKDVMDEAKRLVKEELRGMKSGGPLSPKEETESDKLALAIAEFVLKDIKVV